MASIGTASVTITADLSPLTRSLKQVAGAAESAGESVQGSFKEAARQSDTALDTIGGADVFGDVKVQAESAGESIQRSFQEAARQSDAAMGGISGKVGGGFARLGAIAATGFAAAGGVAIFKNAIDGASDLNESINAVAVTFGGAAGGINDLASQATTSVGLTANEFNGLAVKFSGFATTIAGPGGNVVTTIDDMTTRAADFASVMNMDVNDAATLFQAGLAGETEGLRRFGIDLSAAAVENFAYANGIGKTGEELTEAQKTQARYALLMQETAKTQGDFANTADSAANSLRIVKAQAKEAAAGFGSALLPGVASVTTALSGLVTEVQPSLNALGGAISSSLAPVFEEIVPVVAELLPTVTTVVGVVGKLFGTLAPILSPLAAVIHSIVEAIGGALGAALDGIAPAFTAFADVIVMLVPIIDELAPILAQVGEIVGRVLGKALGVVVSILGRLLAALGPVVAILADALLGVLEALEPVLTTLIDNFAMVAGLMMDALLPVLPILAELIATLLEAIAPLLPVLMQLAMVGLPITAALLQALAPILLLVANILAAVLVPIVDILVVALEKVADILTTVLSTVAEFVAGVIDWFTQLFQKLVGGSIIPDLITGIVGWFLKLPGMILGALGSLVSTVLGVFTRLASTIISNIASFVSNAASKFGELVGRIPGALGGLVGAIAGAIGRAATSAIEKAKGLVTDVVGKIAELPGKALSALGGFASSVASAVTRGLKAGINTAIDGLNALIPNSVGFGPVKLDIPDNPIPHLAMGGIVTGPTMAMLGEGGRSEAVIPLTRPRRAMEVMNQAGLGAGGGINFNAPVSFGADMRRAVADLEWFDRTRMAVT